MALTNAYASTLVNSIISANPWMGLSSATPDSDGDNFVEPTVGGYARTNYASTMGTAVNGVRENDEIIYFPETTAGWGTLTYFGLFSSETADTPQVYGALDDDVTVQANYVPLFRVGQFQLSIA